MKTEIKELMQNIQQQSYLIQTLNRYEEIVYSNYLSKYAVCQHIMPSLEETLNNIQFLNWSLKAPKGEPSSYCNKLTNVLKDAIEQVRDKSP